MQGQTSLRIASLRDIICAVSVIKVAKDITEVRS